MKPSSGRIGLVALVIGLAGFVAYVQRELDWIPITLWNLLPILDAAVLANFAFFTTSGRALSIDHRIGVIVYGVVAVGIIVVLHLAWLLDWWGSRSGSTTSAVAFVFFPLWAILLGTLSFCLASAASALGRRISHRLAR